MEKNGSYKTQLISLQINIHCTFCIDIRIICEIILFYIYFKVQRKGL